MDTLVLPAYCAALSAVTFVILVFQQARKAPGTSSSEVSAGRGHASPLPDRPYLHRQLDALGGMAIFVGRVVQLLCILVLLGLSIAEILAFHDWMPYNPTNAPPVVRIVQCALFVRPQELVLSFSHVHVRYILLS